MKLHVVWCVGALVLLAGFESRGEQAMKPARVVARRPDVPIYDQPDETSTHASVVPPGSSYQPRATIDGWFRIDAGWVKAADVMPATEASAFFDNAIQKDPSAFNYASRAGRFEALGQHDKSIQEATAAIEADKTYSGGYIVRADALFYKGEYAAALKDATDALARKPPCFQAALIAGNCVRQMGMPAEAVEAYSSAIRLSPGSAYLHYSRAWVWSELEKYHEAVRDCNTVLVLDSEYWAAYVMRGAARYRLGELELALADFDEAVRHDAVKTEAYYHRSWIYSDRGEIRQAIEDLTRCLSLKPTLAEAWAQRGHLWYELDESVKSLDDLNEAIRLNPRDVTSLNRRSAVHMRLLHFDEAIRDCNSSLVLEPKSALAYANRGYLWLRKKDFKQARADFDRAVALDPRVAKTYYNRGLLSQIEGDRAGAVADIETGLKVDANADAYYEFAKWLLALPNLTADQCEKAVAWARRAGELSPEERAKYTALLDKALEQQAELAARK
jgi:tetratricopeptide (TPR) repeat protein